MSRQEEASAAGSGVGRQVIEGFGAKLSNIGKVEGFEAKVESWLHGHIPGFAGARIKSLRSPTSGGLSGETYIISLEGQPTSDFSPCTIVLKKDVEEKRANPQANFANLIKIQTTLGSIPGLKVPRVLGFEPTVDVLGQPFLVMEYIAGDIPTDVPSYAASGWVHDASAEQRRRMWQSGIDFLVRLHKLDWQELGLGQLRFNSAGADDLEKCLSYSIEMFRKEAEGNTTPLCERAISWLLANRPPAGGECITWGDARSGNMIWRDFECIAVIDWEMCSLGCPGIDLGWWSFFHRFSTAAQKIPVLDGMCVGQELADLYQARGGARIEHLLYYEILAAVRALSIWLRMYKYMSADGRLPPMAPLDEGIPTVATLSLLMKEVS